MSILPTKMNSTELLNIAAEARNSASAPYSKFQVGAALLAENGKISEGVKSFAAIAISVPGGGSPCGACRQVFNEFNPRLKIYLGDENGQLVRETTLDLLLPDAFGPENLG